MQTLHDSDRFSTINGEALATLRCLPAKSVDMILTDPPYSQHVHANLGSERRNDGSIARARLRFPPIDQQQIDLLAAEYVRVCKGWIITFSDFYSTALWGRALQAAGGAWVRTGQWVKTSPMPQLTGDRPACGAEDILIGHTSADSKPWEWNGKGHAAIWRGGRDRPNLHPNQKPVWLVQSLLGMFCPPGGLVLDPFFGSGTTGVAAMLKFREHGEVVTETSCKQCSRIRLEEYAPPLPIDVRVIGVEGDVETAVKAVERVIHAASR